MPPMMQKPVQDVLRDYLQRNKATGPEWNITSMGGRSKDLDYDYLLDAGKYNIPDKDYDESFIKRIHGTIFENGLGCALLERHLPHGGPVLIDLDFKYTAGDALQRRFDCTMIRKFVLAYITALFRFLDLSVLQGKNLRFFVLKKDGPEAEKGKHKDGIHIHCPDLTLSPVQQYTLRGYMLQESFIQTIFDETGFTNAEQDVFDVAVIHRNNWFLYGATKPNKSWYQVRNIYRISTKLDVANLGEDARFNTFDNELEEEELSEYTTLELCKLLSIRLGHENLTTLTIMKEKKIEWESIEKKWSSGKATDQINDNTITTYKHEVNDTNMYYRNNISNHEYINLNKAKRYPDTKENNGYVYCFTNHVMPGLCKVGFTLRNPNERLKELRGTGVPSDFEIEWAYPFINPQSIEKTLHALLVHNNVERVNENREFFKGSPKQIFNIMFNNIVMK